mmetsp:Transcript_28900/g.67597  ORF Transcript_28900/g.67597 Transcript_28900/m.67597 type:complete len:91 (-) Transcript_28900:169-441(-)|eukprot:CAMPEP_0114113962 /NCGR_PEP_ID=MMETSP0043_2-20121206/3187_1 /TAXON_ID=464988 /ORGANISM="Hemiselmis andersenii, Strain CCMP644" /LENGTH=90 /DNA_ID=CAMNT_0001206137 /DNA_START=265 /DNA_END=537 /DNA_ORIENTATION=-
MYNKSWWPARVAWKEGAPGHVIKQGKAGQELVHWMWDKVSESPDKWVYGWLRKEQMEDFDKKGREKHAKRAGKAPVGFDEALRAADKLSG